MKKRLNFLAIQSIFLLVSCFFYGQLTTVKIDKNTSYQKIKDSEDLSAVRNSLIII